MRPLCPRGPRILRGPRSRPIAADRGASRPQRSGHPTARPSGAGALPPRGSVPVRPARAPNTPNRGRVSPPSRAPCMPNASVRPSKPGPPPWREAPGRERHRAPIRSMTGTIPRRPRNGSTEGGLTHGTEGVSRHGTGAFPAILARKLPGKRRAPDTSPDGVVRAASRYPQPSGASGRQWQPGSAHRGLGTEAADCGVAPYAKPGPRASRTPRCPGRRCTARPSSSTPPTPPPRPNAALGRQIGHRRLGSPAISTTCSQPFPASDAPAGAPATALSASTSAHERPSARSADGRPWVVTRSAIMGRAAAMIAPASKRRRHDHGHPFPMCRVSAQGSTAGAGRLQTRTRGITHPQTSVTS